MGDRNSGPNKMADELEDSIDDINARLEEGPPRAERKELNKRLHRHKQLLAWCKSRAGYTEREK